jgi:hypothetical protein
VLHSSRGAERFLRARRRGARDGLGRVARAAAAEIETWARRHWARFSAALERLHPEATTLFGPSRGEGGALVLAVATLLDRLDRLSPGSKVLETLARRGLDDGERKRLARLVEAALRAEAPPAQATEAARAAGAEVDEALVRLYRWLSDWSGTARALIVRKDWLMRMGLAERRRPKGHDRIAHG